MVTGLAGLGLADDTVLELAAGVQHVAVVDGTLVYVPTTSHVLELNDTAALVWAQIGGRRTVGDIIDGVARLTDQPSVDVGLGVVALLSDLVAAGAIYAHGVPAGARTERAGLSAGGAAKSAGWRRESPSVPPGTTYRALDHQFTVTTTDNDLDEYLGDILAGLAVDGISDPVARYRIDIGAESIGVWADDVNVGSPRDRAGVADLLLWHIQRCAARSIRSGFALHAGVVVDGGRALLLPGAPNAGKSTLVAGLCLAGFVYFTDEIAHVQRGRVRAFRKPVGLDSGSWNVLPALDPTVERPDWAAFIRSRWNISPARLSNPRSTELTPPTPNIAMIIVPAYEPGGATRLERLDRDETIRLLIDQSLAVGPVDGLETAIALVDDVDAFRLSYSELDDGVAAVRGRLATARPTPSPTTPPCAEGLPRGSRRADQPLS